LSAIPLETRLAIVAQVATALAAAHSVGVLHKDVKPANVLMASDTAGRAHAQLGDFGIGAITEKARLAEAGITAMGLTVDARTNMAATPHGTRLYMAPELLEGKPTTMQADIYALGVMLYQIVVGDFARALAPGWERDIDDELVRADIAAAVDGDPGRRLSSAAQLAEQLATRDERRQELAEMRQELAERERQIEAAEQAQAALARARSRRRLMAAAAAVLVLFSGVVAFQSLRIAREARAAEAAAREAAVAGQTAQQVSDFLVALFEEADPYAAQGRDISAREILDRGQAKIAELDGQPEVQATLMHVMGVVYANIGLYQESAALLEKAVDRRRQLHGDRHIAVADSVHALAKTLERQRVYAPAERWAREALALRRALLGDTHIDTIDTMEVLADVLGGMSNYAAAEPLFQDVLAIRRRTLGAEHVKVAQALRNLGTLHLHSRKPEVAIRWYRESLDMYRRLRGEHSLDMAEAKYFLGLAHSSQASYETAETLFLESLSISKSLLGDDHPAHYPAMAQLARLYQRTGAYAQAEPLWHRVLAFYRTSTGERSVAVAAILDDLAFLARVRGDCDQADELSQAATSMYRDALASDHDLIASSLSQRAYLLASWGDHAAAESHYRDALDMYLRIHGEAYPYTAVLMANLAELRMIRGDLEQAGHLLARAREVLQQHASQEAWLLPHVESVQGVYLSRTGDAAAAEPLLLRSYEDMRSSHGPYRMYTMLAAERIVGFHELRGRAEEANKYRSLSKNATCAARPDRAQ
jgi:serine/threonine protein kinase